MVDVWHADYVYSAVLRVITAIASVATAIAIWPIIPLALKIPSQAALQKAHDDLEVRVEERTMDLNKAKEIADGEASRFREFQKVVVGREMSMNQLKKEVNGLLAELNRSEKYEVS